MTARSGKYLSNKVLANVANVSEDYVGQYFKMLTGINPQDYIDLLTARLRRNRELPVEQQIQQPLAWLKKVIQNEKKPDFSPAWKIQEERKSARALLNSSKHLEPQEEERPDVGSALASINKEALSIREAWIEKHISKLIFSNARDQIIKAVLEGKAPSTRLGEILLVRFVNLAKLDFSNNQISDL